MEGKVEEQSSMTLPGIVGTF